MSSPDKKKLGTVKFWGAWRTKSPDVSKDFWMPDQSCRVCYECDSQFTVFNRRHHCRSCGRVFCAKCTSHTIPAPSDQTKSEGEEVEKHRVCNYCFRQWEQEVMTSNSHEAAGASSPGLSPSPSATSLGSINSSFTGNSSTSTVGSMAFSTGPYEHVTNDSSASIEQSLQTSQLSPGNGISDLINISSFVDVGDLCSNSDPYEISANRSDGGDKANEEHYGPVSCNGNDHGFESCKRNLEGEENEKHGCRAISPRNFPPAYLDDVKASSNGSGLQSNNDEPETSLYEIERADLENLDFEKNGPLWIPPEPEDEDDDREADLFEDEDEDEDDGDAAGEWGYTSSSSSFLGGDLHQREKSLDEHSKAMRYVVSGHFRTLITQLLLLGNLVVGEEYDKESWLDIIISLSWEAASLLKPDMSKGSGMDPGGYVKVKCLACGKRSDSAVVKGVVCKKNVAHRRMTSKIERPRLLILGGALEYQRVSNHLSSFDTLLQQEMDHLKMAVAKIDAHHPNILLVEKSVSRYAQEYLLAKSISLVLNVKRPLLERIARCSGAQIVPSIDHLKSPTLGYCDSFHVEKYAEEHGSTGLGGKKLTKTLMFFEECPKPLGCTILLNGAPADELKKVKHVVQYGVFAAYHLALETSYLADEGASLPELPLNSPITVALPDKSLSINRSISTISALVTPSIENSQCEKSHLTAPSAVNFTVQSSDWSQLSSLTGSSDPVVRLMQSSSLPQTPSAVNLSVQRSEWSQSSSLIEPSEPISRHLQSDATGSLQPLLSQENSVSQDNVAVLMNQIQGSQSATGRRGESVMGDFTIPGTVNSAVCLESSSFRRIDVGSAMSDYDSNHSGLVPEHSYVDQIEKSQALKEDFSPSTSDGQSILVSLTTRCVWKGVVCERAHLFRIKFYRSFDKPLGRFLEDVLFDKSYRCNVCEMPSEAHIHCYTHQQGSVIISVRKLTEFYLSGEKEKKIWMWHRCLRCPRINGFPPATRRVAMSNAAWGLSFGKFLELSFSDNAAASRVASCGHSLHKDCLRFYGCGQMVAFFRYAPIVVHSVCLPPSKLEFTLDNQEWITREANEVNNQGELLFTEVLNAINQISEKFLRSVFSDSSMKAGGLRKLIVELERILEKDKAEFEDALQKDVQAKLKAGIDILEINRLRRQIIFQSYVWDQRLVHTSTLNASNFRSRLDMGETSKHSDKNDTNVGKSLTKEVDSCDSENIVEKEPSDFNFGLDDIIKPSSHCTEEIVSKEGDVSQHANNVGKTCSVESENIVRRVVSTGQIPMMASLSDTLDAAWIGEGSPGKESHATESSSVQSSSPNFNSDKRSSEQEAERQCAGSLVLPVKVSDNLDNSTSWLRASFMNLDQPIGKSSSWSSQKLDTVEDYRPVYILSLRELERQCGARLLLPVGMNDTVLPVYDDEPTSVVAYALLSAEYQNQVSDNHQAKKDGIESAVSLPLTSSASFFSLHSPIDVVSGSLKSFGSSEESLLSMSAYRGSVILDPLFYTKALHAKVSFTDNGSLGKVKYTVTCYYAKRFEALRKICCPSELDFIRSFSRCKKWGAQGGKSNVFFAKTLDDRLIIKQVTKTELESFIKFAPAYFKYMSESISSHSPTSLAKILGIYQVTSKHLKGGKETKMDVLVMENLLFQRNVTRLYDLKGSSRSRYNPDSSGGNQVLLDQNLIETMPTSPIFVGNKAKRLLERAVWNDTSFLASIDVMDYSLLVGIDEEKQELVVGIIDFMRQYTWDKHLETWVKASGILGGPKNASPTVISPDQYKKRFRKAMTTYFLMVPDQWSPPTIIPSESSSDLNNNNSKTVTSP